MSEQELKFMALQIAQQLPADFEDARKLHQFIGELIEQWLYLGDFPGGGGGNNPLI
jgi:hypothetical protein